MAYKTPKATMVITAVAIPRAAKMYSNPPSIVSLVIFAVNPRTIMANSRDAAIWDIM